MKTWQIVLLLFLAGAIIGGVIGYGMWHKPHTDYRDLPVDFEVTVDELFNEVVADSSAVEKYRSSVVQVSGPVEEINTLPDNSTSLMLTAQESDFGGGISGRLANDYMEDEEMKNQLSTIQAGDFVTLKCRFVGFEGDLIPDVKLDNCFIVNIHR